MTGLSLSPGAARALRAHALAAAPRECCGLLSASGGVCTGVHPLTNTAAGPDEYAVGDAEQMAVREAVRRAGAAIVGVYHSHVGAAAEPSRADVARWFTPRVAQVIVGVREGRAEVRAFMVDAAAGDPVREIPVTEVEESPAA